MGKQEDWCENGEDHNDHLHFSLHQRTQPDPSPPPDLTAIGAVDAALCCDSFSFSCFLTTSGSTNLLKLVSLPFRSPLVLEVVSAVDLDFTLGINGCRLSITGLRSWPAYSSRFIGNFFGDGSCGSAIIDATSGRLLNRFSLVVVTLLIRRRTASCTLDTEYKGSVAHAQPTFLSYRM